MLGGFGRLLFRKHNLIMEIKIVTILGILATSGSLLVASLGIFSQIRKNFKTKSCGIDPLYITLIFFSYTFWTIYSVAKKDVFIFIPHLLGMCLASIVIWQYFNYLLKTDKIKRKTNKNYNLDLNDRPFRAIKAGTKKIETRVPTSYDQTPYPELKMGDTITFTNNVTQEIMKVEILGVRNYPDVRSMLETEGTRNTLSSGLGINEAIERYNTVFEEYKENIPKYGIYAIEVRVV